MRIRWKIEGYCNERVRVRGGGTMTLIRGYWSLPPIYTGSVVWWARAQDQTEDRHALWPCNIKRCVLRYPSGHHQSDPSLSLTWWRLLIRLTSRTAEQHITPLEKSNCSWSCCGFINDGALRAPDIRRSDHESAQKVRFDAFHLVICSYIVPIAVSQSTHVSTPMSLFEKCNKPMCLKVFTRNKCSFHSACAVLRMQCVLLFNFRDLA